MMASKIVSFDRFIPYTYDDFGIVIAHSVRFPNRWEWFWPQLVAGVPERVLQNTHVVLHIRDGPTPVPEDIRRVEETSNLIVLERRGASTVWANVEGIRHCKTRIIARLNDDVEVREGWVDDALELFNEEPHWKILATIANGAITLPYPKEPIYSVGEWVGELLYHGQYADMAYTHGSSIIANRAVWMGYYIEMGDYKQYGQEDLCFTALSRADDIPVLNFGSHFVHRGVSNQDKIRGIHT